MRSQQNRLQKGLETPKELLNPPSSHPQRSLRNLSHLPLTLTTGLQNYRGKKAFSQSVRLLACSSFTSKFPGAGMSNASRLSCTTKGLFSIYASPPPPLLLLPLPLLRIDNLSPSILYSCPSLLLKKIKDGRGLSILCSSSGSGEAQTMEGSPPIKKKKP